MSGYLIYTLSVAMSKPPQIGGRAPSFRKLSQRPYHCDQTIGQQAIPDDGQYHSKRQPGSQKGIVNC